MIGRAIRALIVTIITAAFLAAVITAPGRLASVPAVRAVTPR